jgi:hypothetical protein
LKVSGGRTEEQRTGKNRDRPYVEEYKIFFNQGQLFM